MKSDLQKYSGSLELAVLPGRFRDTHLEHESAYLDPSISLELSLS